MRRDAAHERYRARQAASGVRRTWRPSAPLRAPLPNSYTLPTLPGCSFLASRIAPSGRSAMLGEALSLCRCANKCALRFVCVWCKLLLCVSLRSPWLGCFLNAVAQRTSGLHCRDTPLSHAQRLRPSLPASPRSENCHQLFRSAPRCTFQIWNGFARGRRLSPSLLSLPLPSFPEPAPALPSAPLVGRLLDLVEGDDVDRLHVVVELVNNPLNEIVVHGDQVVDDLHHDAQLLDAVADVL